MQPYQALEKRFDRLSHVGGAASVLHWDWAAMMPAGGAQARASQLATLAEISHEMLTDARVGDWLAAAEADRGSLDDWQRANLREMRRAYDHATAVGADLVRALSEAESTSEMAWRKAREADDFDQLRPHLEKLVALVRESAQAKADRLGLSPYDALLDQFDPGRRAGEVDRIFDELLGWMPGLLDRVLAKQDREPAPALPEGPFPAERQRALGLELMAVLGFPFDHGRLDVSHHPFSGGVPEDLRITTRYDEADFTESLMAVLHETGHALYEHNLPKDWRHQPVGQARGMSMHESQSLLIEMQACRSRAFLHFAAPIVRKHFDGTGAAWEADNLHRLYTRVKPGLIRVTADEVTYPFHVILRYRLERAMIAGDLAVKDLPEAWRAGMQDLLGLTPEDNRDGCMQDIHWPSGAFGYFPTYTLGALTAAQLFAAAKEADADIEPGIARGDFKPLLAWLGANVHGLGSKLEVGDLVRHATGRPLDASAYKAHLERRYLA